MVGTGVAMGAASIIGGMKASDAADRAASNAQQLGQQQLQLSREQMEFNIYQQQQWESIYGSIQDNLSSYYSNLDPSKFKAEFDVDINESFDRAQAQVDANLASRGLQGSGIEAQAVSDIEQGRADALSQSRTQADQEVARQQAGFLGLGMGQQQQNVANINQSYGTQSSALGNLQNMQLGFSQQYGQSAGGFFQTGGNFLGMAAQSMEQTKVPGFTPTESQRQRGWTGGGNS